MAWARLRIGPSLRPYVRQFFLDLLDEQQEPTADQRQAMTAETAYLLAEQASFGGDSDEHWRRAEQLVAERIAKGQALNGGSDNDRD